MRAIFIGLFLLSACSIPMESGKEANQNRYKLMYVQVGMTEDQLLDLMGPPYSEETITAKGESYDIWFYVTKGRDMYQTEMLPRNMTPFIFKEGKLEGYGYHYLKHIRGDQEDQKDHEYHKKNRYTNDSEEWPKNEHGFVPPNPPKASKEELKAPKSRGQDPMPTYEEEKPAKKKKGKKRSCPGGDSKPEKKSYWWD